MTARRVRVLLGFAALLLLACAVALSGQRTTGAAWSDSAATSSGQLVAHTVVSQTQPACTQPGGGVQLAWTKSDVRYEYAWEVRRPANQVVLASGVTGAGLAEGAQVVLSVPPPPLLSLATDLDVVVRARVSGSSWTAPQATNSPIRVEALLVVGLVTRCGHF